MRFIQVAGNTETARIDGISAAGADPALMVHTPAADLEIVTYGKPIGAAVVPVSPTGCPTPAVITRAVLELLDVETLAVDAGLARPTRAPTVAFGDGPGRDIREPIVVPTARAAFESAREFGRGLPDEEILVGETIPGGTTTALAVLMALGERATVSSSLAENPVALKRSVAETALDASGITPGETAGEPAETVRRVGDPVLAVVAGLVAGATESGTPVTLAGGTQLAAAGALVRHAGVDVPLTVATTSFIAADETADIHELVSDLDIDLTVTDPGFQKLDHPATNAYVAGEAKEGVGMGGALALVERRDISMSVLRKRIVSISEGLVEPQRANQ